MILATGAPEAVVQWRRAYPAMSLDSSALHRFDPLAEVAVDPVLRHRDFTDERTHDGLAAARARGRKGGPKFKMTANKIGNTMTTPW